MLEQSIGQVFRELQNQQRKQGKRLYTLTWRLSEVEIPPAIEEKRSEVTALIREALDAKGGSSIGPI